MKVDTPISQLNTLYVEASIKQISILTQIYSGSNILHFLRFPRLLLKNHFQELVAGW